MIGACMEPGPDSENANRAGAIRTRRRRITLTAEIAAPSSGACLWDLPSEKPFARKNDPHPIPEAKPRSPIRAFRSPAQECKASDHDHDADAETKHRGGASSCVELPGGQADAE